MQSHRRTKSNFEQAFLKIKSQASKQRCKTQHVHNDNRTLNPSRSESTSILRSSRTKCDTHKRESSQLIYNKWYVKPSFRMRYPLKINTKSTSQYFYYNSLYAEHIADSQVPFCWQPNPKLQILNKMPANNLKCLDNFQKIQAIRKKRIPKIVDFLLQKRNKL